MRVGDANDLDAVVRSLRVAAETKGRPTLIVVDSHIGFASARQDTSAAHGEPLGEDIIRATKKRYGWPEDAKFLVPEGVMQRFAEGVGQRGKDANAAWKTLLAAYAKQFPDLAQQLRQMWNRELPQGWDAEIPVFPPDAKGMASRVSGGKVLNAIAKRVPWMIGGSADLTPSTKTAIDGGGSFQAASPGGRNLHFGIREHAMGAICNGLALSGLRPYGSGFMIFSDYMRGSMRLSAIMDLPVVYVFTHDSIGVGEDGPTHQPIEQLPGLRAVPGLLLFRPADANETAQCWREALKHSHTPSVLALTRQDLPTIDRAIYGKAEGCAKGAYIVSEAKGGAAQAILIGTGSEVHLCLQAQDILAKEGVPTRVVSMPCWQLFERQDQAYRDSVLPPAMRNRVAVEMASPLGWERWVGFEGAVVGMRSFGASAPLKQLLKKFGFEPEPVAAVVRATIRRNAAGGAR
jgi:transketolase